MRKSTLFLLLIALFTSVGAYQVFKEPAYRAASTLSLCPTNPCYPPQVRGLLP
ncbi:hypothetical protein [Pseudomonas sp. Au-Pse12]|uniref:hypothetical protein n=1 Tax=Pseudomonas sp. Au-Pse12 TaxID=2906459 RepID=UPI001E2AD26B|nr:hypothetical protein [Pseudomonas sp. Au-Pse12]MCE4052295.1 hypothetical protein [Pseudomonas sp. Au-Pse12]